ncbi:MAG: ATP-binding protein [Rhodoplanes sp.]|uniref:sensor histidine kinase n=1 Tax=Rhodoplanes sp. TaxID=1968906 RepID=UPI001859F78B|nr:histidine kinase dimerization/phosphoacceptor domain -containing protein [Rhodoplanes sp.]NVO16933.1 ATP-binding protein [Rhodoplanes sp.]
METQTEPLSQFPTNARVLSHGSAQVDFDDGRALAQAIVDTIREPLLVLDSDLCVVTANRAFYSTFKMNRQDVQGRPLHALGDGQWDIPALRALLERIAPQHGVMDAYEVVQDFAGIGRRTMLLNARELLYEDSALGTVLLAVEDVTDRRARERELRDLLQQKDILLREMQHRFGNSLQIIASILLIKARTVRSDETRQHLEEAYQRVMSVAAVQQQLLVSEPGTMIEIGSYLSRLCETLAASMIGDRRPVALKVHVDGGTVTSTQAVSIGLIVTELVINAIKHAFPEDRRAGTVTVTYEFVDQNWRLTVSDDGIGRPSGQSEQGTPGLGTTIIEALARQLEAHVEIQMNPDGRTVSITHAVFPSQQPAA